ncbi:MAG: L,D-transpeptidase catalytic domain [Syntrophaceae bacterium PtaB.Bin038]|nr:MAG: L,D-transpeptidase catalytic domain [Syntrophaceae bacterium PtaB.Bin038]
MLKHIRELEGPMKMNARPLPFALRLFAALLAASASFSLSAPPAAASADSASSAVASFSQASPAPAGPADRIVIEKSRRTLTLFRQDREIKSYRVALGRDPVGPKVQQGDNKTPEGVYFVDYKVRNSIYHRALHLSYPNPDDVERARALGVSPGGSIMIHGMKEDKLWMGDVQYLFNWTNGCIALTNREMEELWDLVSVWTPVEIRP